MTTREALIAAASELLANGGPAAVTLREVGKRAGVSHNAPYKHFADKEELLAAVAAADLVRRAGATRRLRRARRPADALRAVLHGFARHALANPELFRLTYGPWREGLAELSAAATAGRAEFIDIVVAAQQDGDLPPADPERVAALLLAVVHGATHLALSGHLARDGKGHAGPGDLVDDLLGRLAA